MDIDRKKLEYLLNEIKPHTVYTPNGKFTWKGHLPEDVSICALFANQFISDKNVEKWVRRVDSIVIPESPVIKTLEQTINEGNPSLESLTRQQLIELAHKKGVTIIRNATKQWLIDQLGV